MDWQEYLRQDINAFHREDCYMAQIALEVRRVLSKKPNSHKLKDFKLKFSTQGETTSNEYSQSRVDASKQFWMTVAGIRPQNE